MRGAPQVKYRVTWRQDRRNSIRSKFYDFDTLEDAQKLADQVLAKNDLYFEIDGFTPSNSQVKIFKVSTYTTFEFLEARS